MKKADDFVKSDNAPSPLKKIPVTTPVATIFAGLPYYPTIPEGIPPICFGQNDHKGCSLDYLDGFGHFLFGFGVVGKNLGKTRVNR